MDTPSVPPVAKSSFMRRKVAGIPVIYLIGAFVAVLVIFAIRSRKPLATPADTGPATGNPTDPNSAGDAGVNAGELFPQMPTGTVVAPTSATPVGGSGNSAIESNDQWLSTAALWLSSNKGISPGAAQAALTKYLEGSSLTYQEGIWRDEAVRQFGYPPDSTPIPITGAKPVPTPASIPSLKQGPLPRTHIVRGPNDNTLNKLAILYYGSSDIDKLQAANTKLGEVGTTTVIPVGTGVYIPAAGAPKYFTATKTVNTAQAIARVNGISLQQLQALNDSHGSMPHFPLRVGEKIRVG